VRAPSNNSSTTMADNAPMADEQPAMSRRGSTDNQLMEVIDTITETNPDVGHALSNLLDRLHLQNKLIVAQNQTISELQNGVHSLERRMLEQERYSSKDCIIIRNLPITSFESNVADAVAKFLKHALDLNISPQRFKACHFLGKLTDLNNPPMVIVKFIYFADKDVVWRTKMHLKTYLNFNNNKPVFLMERLPAADLEVKRHAESQGLITSTYNCAVSVLYKTDKGGVVSEQVLTKDDVERSARKSNVIKRNPPQTKFGTDQQHRNPTYAAPRKDERSNDGGPRGDKRKFIPNSPIQMTDSRYGSKAVSATETDLLEIVSGKSAEESIKLLLPFISISPAQKKQLLEGFTTGTTENEMQEGFVSATENDDLICIFFIIPRSDFSRKFNMD
jgi:hypothetical protein